MRRSTKAGLVVAMLFLSAGGSTAVASPPTTAAKESTAKKTCRNYNEYVVLTTSVFCYGGFGFNCVNCDGW